MAVGFAAVVSVLAIVRIGHLLRFSAADTPATRESGSCSVLIGCRLRLDRSDSAHVLRLCLIVAVAHWRANCLLPSATVIGQFVRRRADMFHVATSEIDSPHALLDECVMLLVAVSGFAVPLVPSDQYAVVRASSDLYVVARAALDATASVVPDAARMMIALLVGGQ